MFTLISSSPTTAAPVEEGPSQIERRWAGALALVAYLWRHESLDAELSAIGATGPANLEQVFDALTPEEQAAVLKTTRQVRAWAEAA